AEESATGDVAAAMFSQNPDLDGVYVSWDVAAEPVVAELRANGMKDVKMVTYDLGGNNDLDMAQKGNTYGKVADMPFQIGATMAKLAALSLLGEEAPPYVVSGTVKMTVDNMVEAWNTALNKNPDGNVMQALGK
ncbi:MAG: substrate-binding domain-containing protein, partial [Bacillota bacterium]